jgi:protein TonB
MAKPLISNDPNPPKDVRFSHFGVLDTGKSSKGAAVTSITVNIVIILLMIVIGAVVKTSPEMQKKLIALTLQPKPPEPKPIPKPIPPPPKPLPVPKVLLEPPKIKLAPVPEKVPDIKPLPVTVPKPVVLNTPAPMKVNPPPAPRVVNLATPKAASIANNDAHPSAVRLGNPEIKALNSAAVATPVNLGGGMHNMNAANTGSGPRALSTNFGSGSPAGSDIHGKSPGAVVIKGLSTGVPGGTGKGANGPQQIQIQTAQAPALAAAPTIRAATLAKPPVITYQPKAMYTPEATALHLAGEAIVSVVLHANGSVQVVGLVGPGLGHGLNESALAVAQGLRFKPALDSTGQPIDFPTKIIVRFVSNS